MTDSGSARILVIDDNRAIHDDFKKILVGSTPNQSALDEMEARLLGTQAATSSARPPSYVIESAFQGEEGYEMVKRSVDMNRRYPVAFVDMRMPPGWDGCKTVEMIWSVDPEIQIVICTAYSDYSWEEILERLTPGDRLLILKKPFDTSEICQLACALTEKWHLARRAHLKLNQLRSMVKEQTAELALAYERLLEEVVQRRRSEERYSLAARGANDGLWDWDLAVGAVYYSPRWKTMLGYDEAEIGESPEEWLGRVHPDDKARILGEIERHFRATGEHLHTEFRMLHKDGQYRWVLCRGISVRDDKGKAVRAAGSLSNITDRKLAEEQLRFEALHDGLTGLANRTLLSDRVAHCLARKERNPGLAFAVMFIDLDHFKVINDSLGHLIGDELLVQLGRRLAACARKIDTIARVPSDHVARFGGDEFVMLLEDLADPLDAIRVAERIHAALDDAFVIGDHEVRVYASIGVATSAPSYRRAEELLRDADIALYEAKEAGKACTRLFDHTMHERAVARWSTENELRRAIENDELVLHYQPIMTGTGELAAFEALVRWQHPARGLLAPIDFIAIAEESGLIVPLGRVVLHQATRQLRAWRAEVPEVAALAVCVNISQKHFGLPGFAEEVTKIVCDHGLPPSSLRIEVTEMATMKNAEASVEAVLKLHHAGVVVDMDDFGTGYSSLSHLHRMPIDALKIDRAFVTSAIDDLVSRSIVEAIVTLAHKMGLRVIAEGVETLEHAKLLQSLRCDFLQGYYFAKPMTVSEATEFLRQYANRRGPSRTPGAGRGAESSS